MEVPSRWGQGDLDQGVKVGRNLLGDFLDNPEVGVPCVREGAPSAEGAHRDRLEAAGRHQGEGSSCSETAGGSSYYVVEVASFVQGEDSSCFEVEVVLHVRVEVVPHVQVEDSSRYEAEALALAGCSYFGEGPAQG